MTVQHDHAVDPVGAILLIADLAVLIGVILLLWLRPGQQRSVPPSEPVAAKRPQRTPPDPAGPAEADPARRDPAEGD